MQTVQTKETMGIRAFISYLSDTLAEKKWNQGYKSNIVNILNTTLWAKDMHKCAGLYKLIIYANSLDLFNIFLWKVMVFLISHQ